MVLSTGQRLLLDFDSLTLAQPDSKLKGLKRTDPFEMGDSSPLKLSSQQLASLQSRKNEDSFGNSPTPPPTELEAPAELEDDSTMFGSDHKMAQFQSSPAHNPMGNLVTMTRLNPKHLLPMALWII
jgi:hypothetical protein